MHVQIPAIIVGVAAGLRWDDYGSSNNCWINNRNYALWSFVGPMLAIIAINSVIFFMVMRNVLGINKKLSKRHADDKTSARLTQLSKGFKATVSFFALLGITWVFGALAIGGAAIVFIYLFAVCCL